LRHGQFDALFILGDLFEVWVGDDVLDPATPATAERDFVRQCVAALRQCSARRPVYVMSGNRDFLIGAAFHQYAGTTPLPDPCVLDWKGQRWLLSHGDAWCLDDKRYQEFRQTVRTPHWQNDFLSRPLDERETVARQLREASRTQQDLPPHTPAAAATLTLKQSTVKAPANPGSRTVEGYADVDTSTARWWLDAAAAPVLIHGHTHRPAQHDLGQGRQRLVLSDWDLRAHPPRAEVLYLQHDGTWQRSAWPPAGWGG